MTRLYSAARNKYGNRKTVIDGIMFDSKHEADRWVDLSRMARAGLITELNRQVKYELVPKQDGERAVNYFADFVYKQDGKTVVEDCKGMCTTEYIIKRKLMLHVHGIKIKEVRQ